MTLRQKLNEEGIAAYNYEWWTEDGDTFFSFDTKFHNYGGSVKSEHPLLPVGYRYMVYITQDSANYNECPNMLMPVKTLAEAVEKLVVWLERADRNFF